MVREPMRITLGGVVQGVGFRPHVHRLALRQGLSGSVRNDGSQVVIDLDGDAVSFLEELRSTLPPLAHIEFATIDEAPYDGPEGFRIVSSRPGEPGVGIPTDTALCERCLAEMSDPDDRRHCYPFTSCTDCGPRFTLISSLPYDRRQTAMEPFSLCPECKEEYADPEDRRYHHQTICCPTCGPRYRLHDRDGNLVESEGPVADFARRIGDGQVGVLKSWGGMHICSRLDGLERLRRWNRREQKPFAVMFRDVESLRGLVLPSEEELALLLSPQRPVVLINKIEGSGMEELSPGLDDLGVFLPYAGVQHRLFQLISDPALIMTSANLPGEPMLLADDDAFSLGADCYLLHDQRILNRADDSVLSHYLGHRQFLRKSRGFTPSYLELGIPGQVLALGGQENITACVSSGGRLYSTQHIGDGDGLGVMEYLESALAHLRRLTGADGDLDAVVMDMHPAYSNRPLGRRLSEESGCPLLEVQHHWAHGASLLVDAGLDRAVVLTLDGTGYGDDGKAWGGEVMHCDLDGYERVGKLQDIPLLGGEKALQDLRRLNFAVDLLNGRPGRGFSDMEAKVLERMMDNSVGCSSMGRLMDALSSQLGVCKERSYDGEPAMKLERLLRQGSRNTEIRARSSRGEIYTAELLAQVEDLALPAADAAYSVVETVLEEMVELARQKAESEGIEHIGLSGGVAYNKAVMKIVSKAVKEAGMKPLFHDRVPNGDGGIAVGQAAIALRSLQ